MMTVDLRGLDELRRNLGLAKDALRKGMAAGAYAVGQNIRSGSMDRVPVDTGALKNSHHVTEPFDIDDGTPTVVVGCGGGAAEQYAIIQHERLDLRHPEGEAKFLEKAFNAESESAPKVFSNQASAYLRRVGR